MQSVEMCLLSGLSCIVPRPIGKSKLKHFKNKGMTHRHSLYVDLATVV